MSEQALESALDVAETLKTRSPEYLWGVSAESIYLAACSYANDEPLQRALEPYYRTEVLGTNVDRSRDAVAKVHCALLEATGLLCGEDLTDLGRAVVASRDPRTSVRVAFVGRLPRLERLISELVLMEDPELVRSDLEGILRDSIDKKIVVPLLSSLGLSNIYPAGVNVDQVRIEQLLDHIRSGRENTANRNVIRYSLLVGSLFPNEVDDSTEKVVAHLLGEENRHISVEQDWTESVACLATDDPARTSIDDVERAWSKVVDTLEEQAEALREELVSVDRDEAVVIDEEVSRTEARESIPDSVSSESTEQVLDGIFTAAKHPAHSRFRADFFPEPAYTLHRVANAVRHVTCRVHQGDWIVLESVPQLDSGTDLREEYAEYLLSLREDVQSRRQLLASCAPEQQSPVRETITSSLLTSLDPDVVKPSYFVYTLPDPDALGVEKMNEFVGESSALSRERAKLRRWSEQRSEDIRRYKEMTDRLFSRGIEQELDQKVLRIMTPYDDDTFSEFASQFRSLLRRGYEIRLVTRHTRKRWQWERLRDNLLGELDENRDNITIRTYSRYKEYKRITSETNERDLQEFGIHAKLQTIGNPKEGIALLGSANFMENSYNWNPECGIYTENVNFVESAIEYFDHVWDLASGDEIDLEKLQEIPRRSYHPSYYT